MKEKIKFYNGVIAVLIILVIAFVGIAYFAESLLEGEEDTFIGNEIVFDNDDITSDDISNENKNQTPQFPKMQFSSSKSALAYAGKIIETNSYTGSLKIKVTALNVITMTSSLNRIVNRYNNSEYTEFSFEEAEKIIVTNEYKGTKKYSDVGGNLRETAEVYNNSNILEKSTAAQNISKAEYKKSLDICPVNLLSRTLMFKI